MGYEKESGIEAPFNMAIATLQRLDSILQQMTRLDLMYTHDSPEKQKLYLSQVKKFYMNAIPLLGEKAEEYKDELLKMNVKQTTKIKSGSQVQGYIYDPKMDYRLNEILIDLQIILKKFFMPDRRETEGLI